MHLIWFLWKKSTHKNLEQESSRGAMVLAQRRFEIGASGSLKRKPHFFLKNILTIRRSRLCCSSRWWHHQVELISVESKNWCLTLKQHVKQQGSSWSKFFDSPIRILTEVGKIQNAKIRNDKNSNCWIVRFSSILFFKYWHHPRTVLTVCGLDSQKISNLYSISWANFSTESLILAQNER
jgi:hypothetical protein